MQNLSRIMFLLCTQYLSDKYNFALDTPAELLRHVPNLNMIHHLESGLEQNELSRE